MLLDSFWDELNIDDISDLHYLANVPYTTLDQKDAVLEKLDWILSRISRQPNKNSYDHKIVSELKHSISYKNQSITLRGVDYLNSLVDSFKSVDF